MGKFQLHVTVMDIMEKKCHLASFGLCQEHTAPIGRPSPSDRQIAKLQEGEK